MYSDKNPNATGNDYELEEKTTTSYQGKFSVYRTDSNFYKQPNSFMKEYEIINITCRPTVAECYYFGGVYNEGVSYILVKQKVHEKDDYYFIVKNDKDEIIYDNILKDSEINIGNLNENNVSFFMESNNLYLSFIYDNQYIVYDITNSDIEKFDVDYSGVKSDYKDEFYPHIIDTHILIPIKTGFMIYNVITKEKNNINISNVSMIDCYVNNQKELLYIKMFDGESSTGNLYDASGNLLKEDVITAGLTDKYIYYLEDNKLYKEDLNNNIIKIVDNIDKYYFEFGDMRGPYMEAYVQDDPYFVLASDNKLQRYDADLNLKYNIMEDFDYTKYSIDNLVGTLVVYYEDNAMKAEYNARCNTNREHPGFTFELKETEAVKGEDCAEIGGYGKPILYLYPEKETRIKVTFDHPEYLTTTYPKYNNSWDMLVKPNGDIYDKNGKYYYALYWEEEKNHNIDFKEGFYVTKDNAIDFLEEKLSYIGLNDKERNEFITYWLPILEKNEKSLVYFELTEERNKYSKINIDPRPDSLLRVAIHVKKVDGKVNIKEEKLIRFKRKGFTAIEWGGINY